MDTVVGLIYNTSISISVLFRRNGMIIATSYLTNAETSVLVRKAKCANFCQIQVLHTVKIVPHFTMTRSTYP